MSRKKHVEQEYIQRDVRPPTEGQAIAMSLGTRGGNIVEVQFENKSTTLCMIPAKFNKKLWIRKGGLVIVDQTVQGGTDAKVTGTIAAVLYPEHLKQFRRQGVKVPTFEEGTETSAPGGGEEEGCNSGGSHADLPANPNQRPLVAFEYTSSDDD